MDRTWWGSRFVAVLALLALSPLPAQSANEMHWTVAGGLGARPDYEGSNDYRPMPIGYLRLGWDQGQYFAVRGTESSGAAVRIEGNVLGNETIELGPVLQYRLERSEVKSGRVDAMDTVDAAIEAGGFLGLKAGDWLLRTTVATDVSSEHDGTLVELVGGYGREIATDIGIDWHVASTWASDGYMGTYFNVDANDAAASGFDLYDADAGFKDVGTRLAVTWGAEEWGGWRIMGVFSYFRLIEDAEDSPVVDEAGDPNQFFGGVALGYAM
jgi:outer membrane protein